ncbi:hypothetical protein [Litoribacillus peritrichatus]|uniref:Transporter n=1 Tax=Litoribacillus peritrichatus TaxID=718191 RepID=A0ABP7MU65_9GAMM
MKRLIASGITLALSQLSFAEGSPWLPEPGSTAISLSQIHQTADELYVKDDKNDLPGDLEQDTTFLSVTHGLNDDFALDFRTGYARSTFDPAPESHESGRTDTNLGVSWRVIDEFISEHNLPSTVIRAGVVLQGNYDTGNINAIGDGADAFELSVISGKIINQWLAVSGELGYRARNSDVPDDIYYKLGTYLSPLPAFTVSLNYSNTNARDGINIGGNGFESNGGTNFHKLEEDTETIDLGISYGFTENISAGVNAAQVIDGKNTANSEVYALTLGYSF